MIPTMQRPRRRGDSFDKVAEEVRKALQRTPYPLLRKLYFEYERGIVILRGKLHSYYHKQLAQEAVRGVHGVTRVVNEIEVSRAHPH